jgi:hypothetical protein
MYSKSRTVNKDKEDNQLFTITGANKIPWLPVKFVLPHQSFDKRRPIRGEDWNVQLTDEITL